jgi:hypothetical protein
MLKKYHEIKWTIEARESFQQIKETLGESPILVIPNYDKEFLIFSFASMKIPLLLYYCKRMKKIKSIP